MVHRSFVDGFDGSGGDLKSGKRGHVALLDGGVVADGEPQLESYGSKEKWIVDCRPGLNLVRSGGLVSASEYCRG